MDPAHLFRILNIFSAHIDRVYQYKDENTSYPELLPNKFGFDNIITVFDYDKTKNIFHHFYGQQANYEGYINKFTSHQPFFYSIDEIAREYLYKVISEKCCITKESIRQISQLINNKIDLLSVRDVCNILSGIDLYIQEDTYNSNYNFNTKSPLTYMISILKLLGISQKDEIKHYILQLPILDLLNCINVFLYIYVVDNFIFKGMMLSIIKSNPSGNMIENKIQIIESKNIYSYAKLSDDQVESCIDKAFRYIIK